MDACRRVGVSASARGFGEEGVGFRLLRGTPGRPGLCAGERRCGWADGPCGGFVGLRAVLLCPTHTAPLLAAAAGAGGGVGRELCWRFLCRSCMGAPGDAAL